MQFEIIAIGNEVLSGETINSNASYLAIELEKLQFKARMHKVIPDDEQAISEALCEASLKNDLVLITGGLGPTVDDFTLEIFAKAQKVNLIEDPESAQKIVKRLQSLNLEITPNQKKQAMIPEGALVLKNDLGTAPGILQKWQRAHFIFLPGVPSEMKAMFQIECVPRLIKLFPQPLLSRQVILRAFGAPEGKLDYLLKDDLKDRVHFHGCQLAFQVKFPEILIKLKSSAENADDLERSLTQATQRLYELLGTYIYAEGETSLAQKVGELLRVKHLSLALAESCTGGYLSHLLTSYAGASEFFKEGIVTYSNESKISRLGVSPQTLQEFGAVSQEVAQEMALGVQKNLQTDYAIALTGIAGPGGGSPEKPVGTVHIAIASSEGLWTKVYHFDRDRDSFKRLAAAAALNKLREFLDLKKS